VTEVRNSFAMVDMQINSWAISIQTGSLTATAIVIAYLFNTTSMAAISLAIAMYLFYRNYKKYGVLLLAAMGGGALIVLVTKTLIHSPRPSNGIFYEAGYSFPSGHTTTSIVFCSLLTYFVWQHWNSPKAKTASSTLSIATIFLVAFDRIYLNVHWFSDVVGGLLLGIFWLTLALWIFGYAKNRGDSRIQIPERRLHALAKKGKKGNKKSANSFSNASDVPLEWSLDSC
jgi:undecaprenyl-diphosphatase